METQADKIKKIIVERDEALKDLEFFKTLVALESHPEMLKGIVQQLETIAKKEFPIAPDEITIKNPVTKIEVANMISEIAVKNFPEELKVSNLKDLKIPKFPDTMRVKNPKFAETVKELGLIKASVKKVSEVLIKQGKDGIFISNRLPKDAIPVVLTTANRESLYNAVFNALGAASSGTVDQLKLLQAELEAHGVVGSGRKIITTAGTPLQLDADTSTKRVWVTGASGNTGSNAVIGDANVAAAAATRQGIPVYKNSTIGPLLVNNLNLLYADVLNDGDEVEFYYEV